MRNILIHLSCLAGLIVLLNRLWTGASLDETLVAGAIAGLMVYLVLLLLDSSIQHILSHTPVPATKEMGESGGGSDAGASGQDVGAQEHHD